MSVKWQSLWKGFFKRGLHPKEDELRKLVLAAKILGAYIPDQDDRAGFRRDMERVAKKLDALTELRLTNPVLYRRKMDGVDVYWGIRQHMRVIHKKYLEDIEASRNAERS